VPLLLIGKHLIFFEIHTKVAGSCLGYYTTQPTKGHNQFRKHQTGTCYNSHRNRWQHGIIAMISMIMKYPLRFLGIPVMVAEKWNRHEYWCTTLSKHNQRAITLWSRVSVEQVVLFKIDNWFSVYRSPSLIEVILKTVL